MPIANEYEALTPEACGIIDDFEKVFKKYVPHRMGFTIRELEYLAHQGINLAAGETVLLNAVAKHKQERQENSNAT